MAYPSSSCLAENLGANLEASQRPERCYARPMADLERILQQLHDSEINAGVQTFYDAGMRVWIGDEANGIQAEATINRTAAARLRWPEGITAASWLHETALRLYSNSKYAKEHSIQAPNNPTKPAKN
jgi:hypothetical protein